MKHLKLLLVLFTATTLAFGKDSKETDAASSYLFMSGKISAQVDDTLIQVKAFDGKRLQLRDSDKSIRPAKDLSCSMKPVMVISNLYADVSELDYVFDSNADALRTMWTINDMESEQMRFEAGTDFENARKYFGNARPGVTAGDKEVMALNELTDNQREETIHDAGLRKWVDNVHGKCVITSNSTLENAYSAMVVSLEIPAKKEGTEGSKRSFVRIVPVGDLELGKKKALKFDCMFPEYEVSAAKLDIFLFNGSGKYVATNLSRGLKEISTEELERFRELERQAKEKKAAQKG